MLAKAPSGNHGITAHAIIAKVKVSIGAIKNTAGLAPAGTMVSLNSSLTPSAIGCSSPNGPTTFGPMRKCIAASTLRSM